MSSPLLSDVAVHPAARSGRLTRVGMERITLPLVLAGHPLSARVNAGVSLDDPGARGIHMSRLYLQLADLAGHDLTPARIHAVLAGFLASHSTLSSTAFLDIDTEAVIQRPALMTGHSGWKAYPISLNARLSPEGFSLVLTVKIGYSSTCLKEMRGEHVPETDEYGISSFSYLARRPFDPQKLHALLHSDWFGEGLLRSKGFFWLASRPRYAAQWSQAGGIAQYGFAGMFWKAVPRADWPTDPEWLAAINEKWQEPFGDMRQELVFIGQNMDKARMRRELDACLIDEATLLQGFEHWKTLPDPFEAWQH